LPEATVAEQPDKTESKIAAILYTVIGFVLVEGVIITTVLAVLLLLWAWLTGFTVLKLILVVILAAVSVVLLLERRKAKKGWSHRTRAPPRTDPQVTLSRPRRDLR